MKNTNYIFRLLLLITIVFWGISGNALPAEAEATTPGADNLYLYQEETQTLLLKGKGEDITEDIADGYKSVTYEYAKTQAQIKYAIVGAGITELKDPDVYLFEDVETLIIGDSVRNISQSAMLNCGSLKSITIGDGITSLPEHLFSTEFPFGDTNSNLETVILGKSVQRIGDYAFNRCTGLKNIVVDPENPYLKIEKKGLYSKDGKKLYAYPVAADGEPVIADGTQKISPAVFACSHVTNIEIPASVTALSGDLFADCNKLEKLTFAENSQCTQTEHSQGWYYEFYNYNGGTFAGCTRLKEVRFGENFQKLAPETFHGSGVRSVYLGKAFQGITKMGSTKLDNIFYWEGYEEEGDVTKNHSVFPQIKIELSKENKNFKIKNDALLSKDGKKLYYYLPDRKNKSYTVPASVETIVQKAFCENKYLEKVNTGKNTKIIKSCAFESCEKLKEVHIGNNTTTIGTCAFISCPKLKKVSLGKKMKTLKNGAFADCEKLTAITNLEKIKTIEKGALIGTKIVYLPDWLTHEHWKIARGEVMYFYTKAGSKKTTWSVTKGKKCVKILKRYKNSARIKVKFQKKGYIVIQAKQGNKKIKDDFKVK